MGLNIMHTLRKLFDKNYATRQVEDIQAEAKKDLDEAERAAVDFRERDVSKLIFKAMGGKHSGD